MDKFKNCGLNILCPKTSVSEEETLEKNQWFDNLIEVDPVKFVENEERFKFFKWFKEGSGYRYCYEEVYTIIDLPGFILRTSQGVPCGKVFCGCMDTNLEFEISLDRNKRNGYILELGEGECVRFTSKSLLESLNIGYDGIMFNFIITVRKSYAPIGAIRSSIEHRIVDHHVMIENHARIPYTNGIEVLFAMYEKLYVECNIFVPNWIVDYIAAASFNTYEHDYLGLIKKNIIKTDVLTKRKYHRLLEYADDDFLCIVDINKGCVPVYRDGRKVIIHFIDSMEQYLEETLLSYRKRYYKKFKRNIKNIEYSKIFDILSEAYFKRFIEISKEDKVIFIEEGDCADMYHIMDKENMINMEKF